MGVSLKTEQRRSHRAVSSFRPWVRRDHSSFSVLREAPMAFFCDYFKKLNGYAVTRMLLKKEPKECPSLLSEI